MITGGSTLKLSPQEIARRVGIVQGAQRGVDAASDKLRDYWEGYLRTSPRPQARSFRLANSIRVTKIRAADPTNSVGTPVFYGRIIHFGVPGRFEPIPHGDVALSLAEADMNKAFAKAAK